MIIHIESTSKITHLNGVPARIWVGETESGIKLHAYITRIAIDENDPRKEEFDRELAVQAVPSAEIEAIPFRLIL